MGICLQVQEMQDTLVQSLGQEDPLEKGMATYSSILVRPHELQHARPPCPSPTPGVHSDSEEILKHLGCQFSDFTP